MNGWMNKLILWIWCLIIALYKYIYSAILWKKNTNQTSDIYRVPSMNSTVIKVHGIKNVYLLCPGYETQEIIENNRKLNKTSL